MLNTSLPPEASRAVPRRHFGFRCDGELAEWIELYAAERGVGISDLLEAAVREFRALAERGVPEIPVRGRTRTRREVARASKAASARRGRVPGAAPGASARRDRLPGAAPGISSRPAVAAPADSVPSASPAVAVWRIVGERMGLDEARARRHVAFRGVLVDGVPCRRPDLEVDPERVRV
jgi:hypothetical protein